MKPLLLLLAITICLSSKSQKKLVCNELPAIDVKCRVMLKGKPVVEEINRVDLEGGELSLVLADPSFQIVGFKFYVGCRSGFLLPDVMLREFWGAKLPKEDSLVKSLRAGDDIGFYCITVKKGDKQYKLQKGFGFFIY